MRQGTGAAYAQFPDNYTWAVSSNGVAYTDVTTTSRIENPVGDMMDTFTLAANVNYLRLTVNSVKGLGNQVSIGEIDIPAVSISSVCSISYPPTRAINYYVTQNGIVNGTAPPVYSVQPKSNRGVESGQ